MKTVTLTQDMRPWRAGDAVPLPDELADKLLASGEASKPAKFPNPDDVARQRRRPATYVTKKAS